ncbi:hypothetical protein Cgig2_030748 [Carnegiea gigantea]|uniref:CCHC-type domain-containing protein n=1 Tax=Carnegiea gigantea TaxID=171969 RepID=A0A9Q1KUJ5_9CARY|nr:hypothetical protein Cgig2_030748 [Carnegiea gigantea]
MVIVGKPLWIRFKYVKLPDYCYGCGKLGHVLKGCDTIIADDGDPNLQYGAWLRASPLKSRRRFAEEELLEEKKFFTAFQKKSYQGNARTKLVFDNPTYDSITIGAGASDRAMSMVVDKMDVIVPINEVFKRKQEDVNLPKGDARKTKAIRDVADAFVSSVSAVRRAPKVVFLSETKKSEAEMTLLLPEISDFFGVFVDARGRADFDLSDHLPILLKCRPNVNKNGDHHKRFLFDNMWITDPSCAGGVSSSSVKMSDPDAVHNLLLKLDECAESLADWNKHTFGHAGAEIRKLELQLHGQHDAISRRFFHVLDSDHTREFIAVMWECRNARNTFILQKMNPNVSSVGSRAILFVKSFLEHHDLDVPLVSNQHPIVWSPPAHGYVKMNFDTGCVGETCWGWGFVLRNHDGDVLGAGTK